MMSPDLPAGQGSDRWRDVDEEFRRIVAGWEPEEPEDVDLQEREDRTAAPEPRVEEEHYVPPPPPPVPLPDGITALALAGAIGGPALLLVATLLQVVLPRIIVWAMVVGFVGGIVTLIWRLDRGPRDPSDPDDGAVV